MVLSLVTCTCQFTQHPHLLGRGKRRAGLQCRAPATLGQDAKMGEGQPSQSPGAELAGSRQASPPSTLTQGQSRAPPSLGSAHTSPQTAAPTLPEPAGAAGSERFTPLALLFLPVLSSQDLCGLQCAAYASLLCFGTFPHRLGCHTIISMQPEDPASDLPPC